MSISIGERRAKARAAWRRLKHEDKTAYQARLERNREIAKAWRKVNAERIAAYRPIKNMWQRHHRP